MDSIFTQSLIKKVKSRLRAREISKNMEPPAKRPFRPGSSRSTQSRPQPRGSFSKGGTKPKQKGRGKNFKTNKNSDLHAYKEFSCDYKSNSYDQRSNRQNETESLQSPHCNLLSEFRFSRSSPYPIRGKARIFYKTIGKRFLQNKTFWIK